VICHNDFAPYNLVFVDRRPRAIIDLDMPAQGYGTYLTQPTALFRVPAEHSHSLGLSAPVDTNRRLRAFCDTYGLAADQRRVLPDMIEIRLKTLCTYIKRTAAAGGSGVERVTEEGHLALYQSDTDLLRRRRDELQKSLQALLVGG
jgi:Ser/Thr protein kinase RdoA (MazF antagonist)